MAEAYFFPAALILPKTGNPKSNWISLFLSIALHPFRLRFVDAEASISAVPIGFLSRGEYPPDKTDPTSFPFGHLITHP